MFNMARFSVVLLHLIVVAVFVCNVNCISDKEKSELMETMKPIAADCIEECGLGEDYKNHKIDDDMDPCFKRCLMKKLGFLDDKGKYNRKALHDSISEYEGDKNEAKKIQDQLDSCFDANGDDNGDDEASEMKRVEVLFQCIKDIKQE